MVRWALSFYAYKKADEAQLDEFIKATGLNQGKMLAQLTIVIAKKIGEGELKDVEVLVKKYDYPTTLLTCERNKKLAAEGVLKLFKLREIEKAQQIIDLFALTKDDFEEDALLKTVESSLDFRDLKAADSIMAFAGLPDEKRATLIRSNLEKFVLAGVENVRPFTDKYGIAWSEVVTAVENVVAGSLRGMTSAYLEKHIKEYELSKEFLTSERVVKAAREGLISIYEICDCNNEVDFLVGTFGLSV